MKILMLGDTHGDFSAVKLALEAAQVRGCEVVIQLGDFGFGWDLHRDPGEQFPARVNALAKQFKMSFMWCDGNHEGFDELERIVDMASSSPQQMGSNLWYLPRGCMFEIAGVQFLALGGAYSIDKDHRVEGVSWWRQEMITNADVERCFQVLEENGQPHVMIAHDVPEGIFPFDLYMHGKHGADSRANRVAVRAVFDRARPLMYFHGHYHRRYVTQYNETSVMGLDCNGSGDAAWAVLDTTGLVDLSTSTL